ncbi:MAG: response regulator [Bacteroidales bacterium]|nr:response regulator [Bacteroidales bacterium]
MTKNVLIVDDSNTNNILLESILNGEGINSLIAYNGNEALKIAYSKKPDLILLDIMMPEKDGLTVFSELKDNNETKSIPVVFITARNDDNLKQKAINAGAFDFIEKPINVAYVIDLVKRILLN